MVWDVPDENGKLSDEEYAAAQEWVKTKWTNSLCPFHGVTGWSLGTYIAQASVMTDKPGAVAPRDPVYPLVVVFCTKCGYCVFLNAVLLGIVNPPPERRL
jgi:hypothetical protein